MEAGMDEEGIETEDCARNELAFPEGAAASNRMMRGLMILDFPF